MKPAETAPLPGNYFVDEAGDGVLFGRMGRVLHLEPDTPRFFMLGMIQCNDPTRLNTELTKLRSNLTANPLFSSIYSMQPQAGKTARAFHSKDDHSDIRMKVFELLTSLDFKFYAVIKDMRAVLKYVQSRNTMDSGYRYQPNDLYDLTVRMLFRQRLHKHDQIRIVFARRGQSDRTAALREQLEHTRTKYLRELGRSHSPEILVVPAYPWEEPCLQIADYCLWALQRCYERFEPRFLNAIWPRVSLIHDVDDPMGKQYGSYFTRDGSPPDPSKIKSRWV